MKTLPQRAVPQQLPSPGWRRVAAFGVDYGIIVAYLGLLTLVGVVGRAVGAVPTDIATPVGRVVAQLVVFAVLTVPVTAWLAGWEATPGGATPRQAVAWAAGPHHRRRPAGVAAVAAADGAEAHPSRELAHTAVWNMLAWPGDRSATVDTVLLSLANAAIAVDLLSLFVASRRTPYDRIAGTVVTADETP